MIRINVPFRLHITLIAMHACSFRKNGGIGLSVNSGCNLTAKKSLTTSIKCNGFVNNPRKLSEIETLVNKISINRNFTNKAEITINGDIYFHSGLGAGTAITLACIEAAFIINNIDYEISDIKSLSCRGGTSGIGVNSYFCGGFILDLGHVADNTEHKPSSFVANHKLPITLNQVPFHFENLFFILPLEPPLVYGENEKEFFDNNTPIKENKAHEICYLSIFGVLASVIERDLNKFSDAINAIQNTEWKSLEIQRAGNVVTSLISELKILNCCSIGMSSLGHGIFFILKDIKNLHEIEKLAQAKKCKLIPLSPSNRGRVIEIV
ncbi:beta-ribofuranosylaminobenzene 5'-phosphate synthase family protein [Thalassotalea agariperforans]